METPDAFQKKPTIFPELNRVGGPFSGIHFRPDTDDRVLGTGQQMPSGILQKDRVGLSEPVAAVPNKRQRAAGRNIDPAAGTRSAVDEDLFGT